MKMEVTMTSCVDQRVLRSLALALLAVAAFTLPATGAEITLRVHQTYLLEEMFLQPTDNQARCFTETLRIPDKWMLAVALESEVAWDEQTKKLKITREQISLVDDKGAASRAIGEMKYYGGLNPFVGTIYHSRPRKWSGTETTTKKHYLVFPVAGKGMAYTLRIADAETKIKTPDTITRLGPEMIGKFEVTGAKTVPEVKGKVKINKVDYATVNRPLSDTFLAVDLTITPTPPGPMEADHFFWHSRWFALKNDLGGFAPVSGEIHMKDFTNNVSHNKSKKSGEAWQPIAGTLYFPVPAKAKQFQLYCAGQPVAAFSIP
jgi:hypothetical protein